MPYFRPKLSDLFTLSQSKPLENHTLHNGMYLYSPYMVVPSPPRDLETVAPFEFRDTAPLINYDQI